MTRPRTFALEWIGVVVSVELRSSTKAVALVCASVADYGTGMNMRAGIEFLAAGAGVSYATAKRAVRELLAAGLLTWDGAQHAPGHPRRYDCTMPGHRSPVTPEHRSRMTRDGRGTGVKTPRNRGQNTPEQGSPMSPYQGHQGHQARGARLGAATPALNNPIPADVAGTCRTIAQEFGFNIDEKVYPDPDDGWGVTLTQPDLTMELEGETAQPPRSLFVTGPDRLDRINPQLWDERVPPVLEQFRPVWSAHAAAAGATVSPDEDRASHGLIEVTNPSALMARLPRIVADFHVLAELADDLDRELGADRQAAS